MNNTDDEELEIYNKQVEVAKNEQDEIDEAARAMLSTYRGRKYLWWLLKISKFGLQPFSGNALTTSFYCGELNVGQQIVAHLTKVDPQGYIKMLQEQENGR